MISNDFVPDYDVFLGSGATPLYLYDPADIKILLKYRASELKAGIALTWREDGSGLLFSAEGIGYRIWEREILPLARREEVPEGVRALLPYAKKIWEATQTGSATGLLRSLGMGSPRLLQPVVELWVSPCGQAVRTVYTQPVLLTEVLGVARGL